MQEFEDADAVKLLQDEHWKKTGCLGYIVDHTTQLCGDYNKPV